jgi:hypothetical protein
MNTTGSDSIGRIDPVPVTRTGSALRSVLLAGCTAATIDLLFAFVFFGLRLGISPLRVLHSVASGLFGAAAFSGGLPTAAAGLVAHYAILVVAAWLYYVASQRLAWLNRNPVACGIAFGTAIYVVMTFVVVPLSAAPFRPPGLSVNSAGQFLIHPVLGLAIAMIVCRSAMRQQQQR